MANAANDSVNDRDLDEASIIDIDNKSTATSKVNDKSRDHPQPRGNHPHHPSLSRIVASRIFD